MYLNKEYEILKKALGVFPKETGFHFKIVKGKHEDNIKEFVLKLENDVSTTDLVAKFSMKDLSFKDPRSKFKNILIANYINPNLSEKLMKENINFLDTVGNVYINIPPLYFYVSGKKESKRKILPSAFSVAGVQLIFVLLNSPEAYTESYRQLANKADIGLGTITNVLRDLKNKGYLISRGKLGRKLRNIEGLIDEWVKAYNERLRNKLVIEVYKTRDIDFWKKSDLKNWSLFLGGECAAAKLTNYLKPEIVTLYAKEKSAIAYIANKYDKAKDGNIELLKKFWHFESEWEKKGLVPPLLVYADLMSTNDPRNIETAKIIYEKEILKTFKTDLIP